MLDIIYKRTVESEISSIYTSKQACLFFFSLLAWVVGSVQSVAHLHLDLLLLKYLRWITDVTFLQILGHVVFSVGLEMIVFFSICIPPLNFSRSRIAVSQRVCLSLILCLTLRQARVSSYLCELHCSKGSFPQNVCSILFLGRDHLPELQG